jgi:hypothetical protein
MEPEVTMEAWRSAWQSEAAPAGELEAHVARETGRMRWMVGLEIVVTVAMGGGTLAWAVATRRLDITVLAVGVWLLLGVGWAITLRLGRDAWRPLGATTAAFLDLAVLRCRRRRAAIVARAGFYVLVLGFDLSWLYWDQGPRGRGDLLGFLAGFWWVWAISAALAAVGVWQHRRLGRQLQNFEAMQRALAEA